MGGGAGLCWGLELGRSEDKNGIGVEVIAEQRQEWSWGQDQEKSESWGRGQIHTCSLPTRKTLISGRERPRFSQMPASMARMVRPGRARAKEAVPSGRYTQQYFPGRLSLSPSVLPRLFRWL